MQLNKLIRPILRFHLHVRTCNSILILFLPIILIFTLLLFSFITSICSKLMFLQVIYSVLCFTTLGFGILMEFTIHSHLQYILPPLHCRLITESFDPGKGRFQFVHYSFLCMHLIFLKKFPNNVPVPSRSTIQTSHGI